MHDEDGELRALPGAERGRTTPMRTRAARWTWRNHALAFLISVVLSEGLLRLGFGIYASQPMGSCGERPERLARLIWAYHRERPGPEPSDAGLVPDPHRGYRHAPDQDYVDRGGERVSTNAIGARGGRDYPVPRRAGVARIVALGDSFTFGNGVADDATWPAQLEATLDRTEVVNLGEPAYAHDQMYFALEDTGASLEPDVVILGFYEPDLWRDELTFYCAEKPRFTHTSDGWVIENVPVPPPWEAWDRHRTIPLLYALPRALFDAMSQEPPTDRAGEERAAEILRRTDQLARSSGARFVLLLVPDQPERQPPSGDDFFHRYCEDSGVECVDPSPLFAEERGDEATRRARLLRPNDIHYTREGYAILTTALRRHFEEHPIVPRSTQP